MPINKNYNNSIIFHIIRLSETIKKHGDTLTNKYTITTQQWIMMLLITKDPNSVWVQENAIEGEPLSAKDLALAMNVSRANISNLLTPLIQKKLVQQTNDGVDKRRNRITLTAEGERIINELEIPRIERNDALFANFSQVEKENFLSFVQQALKLLKADEHSK